MNSFLVISGFWLLIVLPFIDATFPALIPEPESPYYVEVKKYEQCKEHRDTKLLFKDMRIDRVAKDNYTLSGEIDVLEDLPGPLYMGAKVEKCKEKPDSCEHVMNQVFQDLCQDLEDKKSQSYTVMHVHLSFKDPKCPLKKGHHRIASKQFDSKKAQSLGLAAKFWKVQLFFYGADKITPNSCVYFELAIREKTRERHRNMG